MPINGNLAQNPPSGFPIFFGIKMAYWLHVLGIRGVPGFWPVIGGGLARLQLDPIKLPILLSLAKPAEGHGIQTHP